MKQTFVYIFLGCVLLLITSCNSFLEGLAMGINNLNPYINGGTYATTPISPSYASSSSSGESSYSTLEDNSSSRSEKPSVSKKKCMKLTSGDLAHCNGTGVCTACNGKGKYLSTAFGISKIVDPCIHCHGTGKCPSCHGTGYRN